MSAGQQQRVAIARALITDPILVLADEVGLKLNHTLKLPTTEGVVKLTIVGLTPGHALIGNEQVLLTLDPGSSSIKNRDHPPNTSARYHKPLSPKR